ncbi:MAG TPA: ATP-binding protein [Burkholderiales bacterium]|nr:ATP-binding protein [Burkholderiales bacterium]
MSALLRGAGYALMALALAGGWAFLYWRSSAVDLAAVEAARGALGALRRVDSGWNRQLVDARLGAGAPPAARYGVAYAALEVRALRLGDARVGSLLPGLKRAFADKAARLARYAGSRAEGDFEAAWLASTGPRLDLLERAVDRTFDDALTEAELYRMALLFYSGFLLAVLTFLAWSLEQRRRVIDAFNRQLRGANETLEARVAERTQELSGALKKLKESEAMLIQSEKMSSLGQMVAGIAHEVNTPLAYVKASLESVAKSVPEVAALAAETDRLLAALSGEGADEAALAAQFAKVRGLVESLRERAALEEIGRMVKDGVFGIGQISEVIGNLKNFSRLDRSKVADYDLREGLESALRIAQHQLKDRTVRKDFGAVPRVACSPSQINQVLLNLISNAAQATRDGEGVITLRTAPRGDAHVAVEVVDNGHGIPAEVLPKVFDPFFTTKEVGKGTGLGLSICYKIVENHGGKLEVQSRPGVGTRFTLVLPVRPPAAQAA